MNVNEWGSSAKGIWEAVIFGNDSSLKGMVRFKPNYHFLSEPDKIHYNPTNQELMEEKIETEVLLAKLDEHVKSNN